MNDYLIITKALSDETRVRALMALGQSELCLCQLIELLQLAPSTVSKHMAILHRAGLVERRKEGKWHFFRLASTDVPPLTQEALRWSLDSLRKDSLVQDDLARLRSVCSRDLEELSSCYRS